MEQLRNENGKAKRSLFDNRFCNFFKNGWEKFTQTTFGSKMTAHFQRQGYLYFSFFVPALLFFMVFILQGTYPFGIGSVLVLDLNGQYVYFFEALRKAIYGDASLLYSWSGTLGGEFIGIYAYYLASPISYLVALFPEGAMTEALLVIELVKCGFCGLTMAYYLRKSRPMANEMITIMISIMYALCAFGIVMAHNTMWIDCLIWLPMVTYGIERLVNYGHFKLFIVALTMSVVSNFYIGYMVCFYVAIYFFYYYFFASHRSDTKTSTVIPGTNNFVNERSHFFKSLVRIGVASVIALLIACFIILPTYYSLTLGKTTFSDPTWSYSLVEEEGKKLLFKFNPLEMIGKLFIASYDTVRLEGLPFLYCGMLTLILVPVYFISKRVNRRQKVGAALILAVFFLSMIIDPIDMLWHGAQAPNWLNYRYSFMVSFILLVLAHRALELLHTVKFKKTVIIAAVWAVLVLVCAIFMYPLFKIPESIPEKSTLRRLLLFIILPIAVLAIYEAAHYFLAKDRFNRAARSAMLTTLAIIVCLEMFIGTLLNTTSLNEDVTFSPKFTNAEGTWLEGYDNFIDRFRPIVNAVQASDDTFYRMEKDNLRKYGDCYPFAMRGLTGSTSTLNEKTITFLRRLGYISYSNISSHKGDTSVADSLLGIKYLIGDDQHTDDRYYLEEYKVMTDADGNPTNEYNYQEGKYLYALKNLYALSIAYTSSSDIKDFNITETASPFATMNDLVQTISGKDYEIFKKIDYLFSYSDNVEYSNASYNDKKFDKFGDRVTKKDEYGNTVYEPMYKITTDKDGKETKEIVKDKYGNTVYDKSKPVYEGITTPYHTFTRKEGNSDSMTVTLTFTVPDTMSAGSEVFFKIPTAYAREADWTFTNDRNPDGNKNGSVFKSSDKTDCILSLGTMNPGDTGKLTLNISGANFYIDRNEENGIFYYVDETVFKEAMNDLKTGNFIIEDYTESSFTGSIETTEGKTSVFTTIPYEKYWEVYVDGKQVETYMTCAALVGFDVGTVGNHKIEIVYNSDALNTGLILSGIGILLFAGWIVVDSIWLRKKRLTDPVLDYTCLSEGDYQDDGYDEEVIEERKNTRRKTKKRGK